MVKYKQARIGVPGFSIAPPTAVIFNHLLHQVPNGVIQLSWTLTSLTPGTPLAI
jgi:hypothetical protein